VTPLELVAAARAWRDEDPDPATRAELDRLLAAELGLGAKPDLAALRDRFATRLEFGTAGLRGEMGAGPNRMNRAVAIRATAGLAAYLTDLGHRGAAVIVGYDARHRSTDFARDAAAVLIAAGYRVLLADRPLPTPLVAFGVLHYGCCAGIQITASHNPPGDNGYKVYLGDGAQIVPPADGEISARIDAVGPLAAVPRASADDPRLTQVGSELTDAYVSGVIETVPCPPASAAVIRELRVVYTPLHGVGRDVIVEVFTRAGFAPPHLVPAQAAPDPDFPTVAFPNPEEPGALDLALELAHELDADVVLANDPDADRLAVAVPDHKSASGGAQPRPTADARPQNGKDAGAASRGGWRVLSGDEIGILLGDWLLSQGRGHDRLVATTVVSSSMLGELAAARGVESAETLTGFKWIVRPAMERPDLRFVYGYEEALGSCVGSLVRDKDGISAALAFARLVAEERSRGRRVTDRLDGLARELGVHATGQRSIPLDGAVTSVATDAIDALARTPPSSLGGRPVEEVEDLRRGERLPPADVVVLRGHDVRVIVRTSGTEPKLKCYAEAVVVVGRGISLANARRRAGELVEQLLDEAVAQVSC
jgi:phosphomannomutase